MIATLVVHEGQPTIPLPRRALDELGLRAGQYVRVDVQPLGVMESDGTPAH